MPCVAHLTLCACHCMSCSLFLLPALAWLCRVGARRRRLEHPRRRCIASLLVIVMVRFRHTNGASRHGEGCAASDCAKGAAYQVGWCCCCCVCVSTQIFVGYLTPLIVYAKGSDIRATTTFSVTMVVLVGGSAGVPCACPWLFSNTRTFT